MRAQICTLRKEQGIKMEIKTFDNSYLQEVKNVLKDVFFNEYSKENYNEWEFAESVLKTNGYIPELCLIALEENQVIGYNALTIAKIGETEGLALGPLGVKQTYQNKGIGTCLVEESIRRAKKAGYPWIVLLGGNYYSRFGFEKGLDFHIVVSDNASENAHIQILFLDDNVKNITFGKLIYCDAFYDAQGNLI